MRTRWFDRDLDSVTTVWRLERRDGVALGFTAHDRDLWIGHFRYMAAPGMLPSAIELDDQLDDNAMDVGGSLSHDLISEADLTAGRWDGAKVCVGLADWTSNDLALIDWVDWIFYGELGQVEHSNGEFTVELMSLKAQLDRPFVPHSSPSCRAEFCGPGCTLSRPIFEQDIVLSAFEDGGLRFEGIDAAMSSRFVAGSIAWTSGENAGLTSQIWRSEDDRLFPDFALSNSPQTGDRARILEGCDKSLETCANRFSNAINFQGEPHLPGNDLLTRYSGGG